MEAARFDRLAALVGDAGTRRRRLRDGHATGVLHCGPGLSPGQWLCVAVATATTALPARPHLSPGLERLLPDKDLGVPYEQVRPFADRPSTRFPNVVNLAMRAGVVRPTPVDPRESALVTGAPDHGACGVLGGRGHGG